MHSNYAKLGNSTISLIWGSASVCTFQPQTLDGKAPKHYRHCEERSNLTTIVFTFKGKIASFLAMTNNRLIACRASD